MTDDSTAKMTGRLTVDEASERRKARLKSRFAAETRFKMLGLGAVLTAVLFLVLLLNTVVGQAIPAFTQYYAKLPADFSEAAKLEDPAKGDFNLIFRKSVAVQFSHLSGRKNRKLARGLFASSAGHLLSNQVKSDPAIVNSDHFWIPLSDFADLYMKGLVAPSKKAALEGSLMINGDQVELEPSGAGFSQLLQLIKQNHDVKIAQIKRKIGRLQHDLSVQLEIARKSKDEDAVKEAKQGIGNLKQKIASQTKILNSLTAAQTNKNQSEKLSELTPSVLISAAGGIIKIAEIGSDFAKGQILAPLQKDANPTKWDSYFIAQPESERNFGDKQLAQIELLKKQDRIERRMNAIFFTSGASREPELAGIWGAVVGSFFTLVVTLLVAFPLGVAAAIYLEEFAPKNRLTDFIEVNINNLAAVPSIVFGLLGLAVFLNFLNLPRSAPVVGGIVLALMTLPTIIIASRAALKAVPPSIREAALGIGASKIQSVFHHVLPLALPGIFTGTIIGMAQALGETAPLLMIGMVAFIVDIPGGFLDPATVLPVQIYMWADFPEPAFQQKTAAAIVVLLLFLILMNLVAVLLRRRFERRW